MPASTTREPGLARIAGVDLLERIGAGGTGLVYRGHHPVMAIDVAVKLLDATAIDRQRFHLEARLAARLQHPHVVTLYNAGEEGDYAYLVMELVAGGDCARRLRDQQTLPWRQAVTWVRDAARGLGAAHDLGIVHRDVKPANLLLTEDGQVKLADLGLARPDQLGSRWASSVDLVGTVGYMAPEQIADPEQVGPWTDVYALGVTLYELVAGEPPFASQHTGEVLAAHLQQPAPDLAACRPGIPAALGQLVQRMLSKDPALRPPDGQAVADALERILERPDGDRRLGASWNGLALLAVPLVAMVAASATLLGEPQRERGPQALPTPTAPVSCAVLEVAGDGQDGHLASVIDDLGWDLRYRCAVQSPRALDDLRAALEAGRRTDLLLIVDAAGRLELQGRDGRTRQITGWQDLDPAELRQACQLACRHLPLYCDGEPLADGTWRLRAGRRQGLRAGDRLAPFRNLAPVIEVVDLSAEEALARPINPDGTIPAEPPVVWQRRNDL